MPYEVDGFGPQTWNLAKSVEHWDTCFLENRSTSGFFHPCLVHERERKRGLHEFEILEVSDRVKEGVHLARHTSPERKMREVLSFLFC